MDQKQFNIDFYNSLKPLCEEFGTKIALENMFGHDDRRHVMLANVCSYGEQLAEYYDALDPRYFTVCLDLGHSGLVGDDAAHAIRALGHRRLTALHVHDNNYMEDLHVTLEDDGFISKLPKRALINGTRLAADLASELRDMIAL